METIFKIGMKVYDQVFFPNRDGKIVQIYNKSNRIQIEVKFFSNLRLEPLCMQESVFYTEKGNMINFCAGINCETSTLSTEPYKVELQGFEQKAPAPTFEEAVNWLEKNSKDRVIYADEAYINEEYERAFEVLKKLVILREYYNNGLKQEDLGNVINAIIIERVDDEYQIVVRKHLSTRHVLFFKSEEIAFKFLEEQKELLEIAKPLL